jgi:hypothetical protein
MVLRVECLQGGCGRHIRTSASSGPLKKHFFLILYMKVSFKTGELEARLEYATEFADVCARCSVSGRRKTLISVRPYRKQLLQRG